MHVHSCVRAHVDGSPGAQVFGQLDEGLPLGAGELAEGEHTALQRETPLQHRHWCEEWV